MKRILLILCALFSIQTFAASLPDKIKCKITGGNIVDCTDPQRPHMESFYYKDDYGNTKVGNRETRVMAGCRNGICSDTENNPRGEENFNPSFRFMIHREYYLKIIGDDVYAVRFGTAPTSAVETEVLDIWCDPQGDTCTTPKGELSREELPKHFKFADVSAQGVDCMQELCYNQNQDVVGLNPEYSLYQ